MTRAPLVIDEYRWAGGREAMLRVGAAGAPTVLIAPALFEEANRTRALAMMTLRLLAGRGIAGALPDLPGQGESGRDLTGIRLVDWRGAFAAAAGTLGRPPFVLAIRGGALVDDDARVAGRYHLAPLAGAALVPDLLRVRRTAALAAGEPAPDDGIDESGPALLLAGNRIERSLLCDLATATPRRADRLVTPEPAGDGEVLLPPVAPGDDDGPATLRAPWRASEPVTDPVLAAALADDVARWIASCDA